MNYINEPLGWKVLGVVDLKREWCVRCAKARVHEITQGWAACLVCTESFPIQPKERPIEEAIELEALPVEAPPRFEIVRFLKESFYE